MLCSLSQALRSRLCSTYYMLCMLGCSFEQVVHGIFRFSEQTRRGFCARPDGKTLRETFFMKRIGIYSMSEQGYKKFIEQFENISKKYANKTIITYMRNDSSKTKYTFDNIFNSVCKAKENFFNIGLKPGDRAAIIAPHSPYAVIAGLALAYSNITCVLIDSSLPVEEINRILLSVIHPKVILLHLKLLSLLLIKQQKCMEYLLLSIMMRFHPVIAILSLLKIALLFFTQPIEMIFLTSFSVSVVKMIRLLLSRVSMAKVFYWKMHIV